jgi:malate dehydrogenase (quinone)
VTVKDLASGAMREVMAKFVFIGAGGGALPLVLKSGIAEGHGYGGFPVSGQWLVCHNPEVIARHQAKVYGKASVGAPPMSVPHLDTRMVNGQRALLFGPYAGFTTKYLKHGSYLDMPKAIHFHNLWPMAAAAWHNLDLTRYLIGEVLKDHDKRMASLREFMPEARSEDWTLAIAGQRVQIIKKDPQLGGKLEFGTELLTAADGTLAALMGASPGASTAAATMIMLVHRCFPDFAKTEACRAALQRMVPSYGHSLSKESELLKTVRDRTNGILGLA